MRKILFLIVMLLISTAKLPAQTAVPAEALKKQLLLDSLQIAYVDEGEGAETLLLIHGLGGSKLHWQQNIPALSRDFRTLTVDLPGYGSSRLQNVPQDSLLHFFSASLLALLDSLSIPKVHVAGHSMGGQIAMLFALQHPERVEKLVLAAPAGIETFNEAEAQTLRTYAAATYPQKPSEEQIRQNYAMNFYRNPAPCEELIQERIALNESAYYPIYAQLLTKAVEGMLDTPLAGRLSELQPPVLLLFGADDQLIPNRFLHPEMSTENLARQAQQTIPNCQLVMIAEAGHLLMFEQAEAFNQALINFLKKSN